MQFRKRKEKALQFFLTRAKYGAKILDSLSSYLTGEYGRELSSTNLSGMRKFYLVYRDRDGKIIQSPIGQLRLLQEI